MARTTSTPKWKSSPALSTSTPMRAAIADSGAYGGSIQFPYDWRKPLVASAGLLRDLILKASKDYQPVHLIGHSMGGLMIRTALMLHGDELWPKVGRIVFIATPHYGSPSIAGYLKNHLWGFEQLALVGAFISRETFRSLWGVLSLMPAPAGRTARPRWSVHLPRNLPLALGCPEPHASPSGHLSWHT